MSRKLDLTGHKYGRWTVLQELEKKPLWLCRCECGTEKPVMRNHLRSGHSRSCGCLKAETSSETNSAKLEGQRFGRLTVVKRIGSLRQSKTSSHALWECLCDCGNKTKAISSKLLLGHKQSCGCLFLDRITTHGKARSRVYNIWQHMHSRCSDKAQGVTREHYFARGIRVCDRWKSFESFLEDMGEPLPDQSLDRIDVNGNYEPGNCRWATRTEQARNKRSNRFVTVNGKVMHLTDAIQMLRDTATPRL